MHSVLINVDRIERDLEMLFVGNMNDDLLPCKENHMGSKQKEEDLTFSAPDEKWALAEKVHLSAPTHGFLGNFSLLPTSYGRGIPFEYAFNFRLFE